MKHSDEKTISKFVVIILAKIQKQDSGDREKDDTNTLLPFPYRHSSNFTNHDSSLITAKHRIRSDAGVNNYAKPRGPGT